MLGVLFHLVALVILFYFNKLCNIIFTTQLYLRGSTIQFRLECKNLLNMLKNQIIIQIDLIRDCVCSIFQLCPLFA